MIESNHLVAITLREEETVEEILAEVGQTHIDLDEELENIIRMGEEQMQAQYQAQAEERHLQNRQGINFEELKEQFDLDQKEQPLPEIPKLQQSELSVFERENIRKSKLTQNEIMELDGRLPKLNYTGMLGQRQNIFGLRPSIACHWLGFKKIAAVSLRQAMRCRMGEVEWIILASRNELVIFMGQVEPMIMTQSNLVTAMAMSACRKYLAVAVQSQLIVYEIRKGNNLILLKNFADLKVGNIICMGFYEGVGPRIYFIDDKSRVVIITIQLGMILTKVRVEQILHKLQKVDSVEVIRINNQTVLMAVGGSSNLKLITIQPQIQFIQTIEVGRNVLCLWRRNGERTQLVVASQNRIIIYRLHIMQDQNIYYLQEHLLYLNHYPIEQMFLISQLHILIQSVNSFVAVALPLIPSVVEEPELAQSETAIVFAMAREEGSVVLQAVEEGILVVWGSTLQVGRFRALEQELDQLMVQQSAYREAFSLLVLVSKGMNYSFRFSYAAEDLKRLIYSAIEVSVSTLLPKLDKQIVMFRVGWVVQLCVQCHQQLLLWNSFYPKLKQKQLQLNLFEMVQIFVLKGQLTHIPEEIFLEMVAFFAQKGKQVVIENLVLSNKEAFEATRLLSLLNQKQMNYLQFYLFSRGILSEQYDFYTPFLRAFTAFTRNQDARTLKTTESALLCYWILSKTFSFEHVPSGQMTRDTKIVVVTEFFVQILARTFVRRLADFNLRLFLEALLIPFLHSEFKQIIFEEESLILQKFKELNGDGKDKIEGDFVTVFLTHLQANLGLNRSSSLWAQFYATILYLTHSSAKFQRIIQILAVLFQKRFYRYELRISLGQRAPAVQVKQYLVKLVQEDLMQRQDRLYMKKLLAFEDREIGYLLHKIDRNYQAALEQFLGNYGAAQLFAFATEIHKEIERLSEEGTFLAERKRNDLRAFLVRNVGLLFRTDGSAALELFYLIGMTTKTIHETIVEGHFQQREKLHFLTAVLTKWQNEQFELKQQYMLEHLEEVCSLPQAEMRAYLDRFYYPLDSAIRVADQRGNYLAKAIFQTRSGLIEQAFASYQKLIRVTLLANRQEQQTRTKVSRYIQQCVQLCKLYSGQSLQQNLWVKLIRFITSFVASQHQYKVYLKVELERANQNIIAEMLRFLTTTLLISYFTSPQIPLPAHKLLPIHAELFRVVRFDKINIQRGLLVFKKDLQQLRIDISKQNKIAIGLHTVCDFCRGALAQEERNLAYSCGHSFHRICHDDTSICLTCSYESDSTLFYKAIFHKPESKKMNSSKAKQKKKGQIINQDIYVQTLAQARNQTRKKRLKVYDFEQISHDNRIYELTNTPFRIDDLLLL